MNWKTPWLLFALALTLFAFIFLVERHQPSSSTQEQVPRLLDFKPEEVTSILLRRTNQLVLKIDRTNGLWQLSLPLNYPARYVAIEQLLQDLQRLDGRTYLAPDELKRRNQTIAEFMLDVPVATLTLQHAGKRTEIMFGAKTPMGDRVYVQLLSAPGIYVADASAFDRLPPSPDDWRDASLVPLNGLRWDRLEVRMPARMFALQLDPTNRNFYLSKPTPTRANPTKVEAILRAAQTGRVTAFVSDNPRVDLEPYGLQTPVAELVFALGTNDQAMVQFGGSPTNDNSLVYARCLAHTNIVLVSRDTLEALQSSHAELREKRLITVPPGRVDVIEVVNTNRFVLRRQADGEWAVTEPVSRPADRELVGYFFKVLGQMEGDVERDVVTDLTAYGLAPAVGQLALKAAVTNAAGAATNLILTQLEFGASQDDRVFVRRTDEASVYTISQEQYEQLPREAWQLRDRRVWSFSTNQISAVNVTIPGQTIRFLRDGPANWSLAPGSQGSINDLAIEETIYRLGDLHAEFWTAKGDEQRERYGFNNDPYSISVELKGTAEPKVLKVEFGGDSPTQYTYALTEVDGQSTIFEFPKKLQFELVRDLMLPFMKNRSTPPGPN